MKSAWRRVMLRKLKFNWFNISKSPDDEFGIYSIWTKSVCVYVGKAEKQSLRVLLLQHYHRSHNDQLNAWIKSSHQLWFTIEPVKNLNSIDAKERNRIKNYAPLTNVKLTKKENQYGNQLTSV